MPKINPLVPLAGLGLLLLLGGSRKASAGENPDFDTGDDGRGPWTTPIPVPTSPEDLALVGRTVCDCWSDLGATGGNLIDCVAKTLHPDVPWPPQEGDHATVIEAWEIFAELVELFEDGTDAQREAACAEITGPKPGGFGIAGGDALPDVGDYEPPEQVDLNPVDFDPGEVLDELVSHNPMPGRFYQVKAGDTISSIARRALDAVVAGAGSSSGARLDYIYCMSSGAAWNLAHWGSTRTTQIYPALYAINGLTLAVAFLPYHEDPVAAYMEGRAPNRGANQAGNRIAGVGNAYGLLWLPPVDPQVLADAGEPTCGAVNWTDGSSSIDPPPEFFALIGA